MTKLNHALALAQQGFYVFPLEPNSKLPAIDAWQKVATREVNQIKKWWTCPVMEAPLDRNIGIHTGCYGEDKALVVIDVDVSHGVNGMETLKQYDIDLSATLVSQTASGGLHIIYVVDEARKQGAGVLGPGLDIRSRGGYIVAPGSTINDNEYHWVEP